jgi:proteic killer suppression protein
VKIRHEGTLDIFNGRNTENARRTLPTELHAKAGRLLDRLNATDRVETMRTPPGNRLHKLTKDRADQWGISINDQYRICFQWENGEAVDVEITDYH